jgi:hypothetical protein
MTLRLLAPSWGRVSTFVLVLVCAAVLPAVAQPKGRTPAKSPAPAAPLRGEKTDPPTTKPADKPEGKPAEGKAETKPTKGTKEQNFNFEGLGLNGRSRSPQLLYFLERANEELERASLEKRSFIPHMVRTVEEEAL